MTETIQASQVPKPKAFKRSIFVINKKLQYKYMGIAAAAIVVALLMVSLEVYFSIVRKVGVDMGYKELYPYLRKVGFVFSAKFLVYAGVLAAGSIFLSHRLAGPLFRLEKSLEAIASGDLTYRMWLRPGDELTDFKDKFNKTAEAIQVRLRKDIASSYAARQDIEKIAKEMESGHADPKKILNDLELVRKMLEDVGSGFKV